MCTLNRSICLLPLHKWRNTTHWIPKYGLDALTNVKAIANLEHLMNIKVLFGLSFVLMLLEVMHNLIKFSHMWNICVRFQLWSKCAKGM
jgi:hypothetical protein